MFCSKCGRDMGANTSCPVCDVPQVEEFSSPVVFPYSEPTVESFDSANNAPMDKGSRKAGLGLGIAAAAVSLVGFSMAFVGYIFGVAGMSGGMAMFVMALVPAFIGGGCGIASLIMGIISLTRAIKQKKRGQVLPIPAMALGIESIVMSVSIFMIVFAVFLLVVSMTMAGGSSYPSTYPNYYNYPYYY